MPLLSVIVPVYNAANYLASCIESILNQDFTDLELILIDDGSSDGSGELCDNYARKDQRVRVTHQENQGQAVARNKGIEMARGTYIGFCDNDDLLHPDMFAVLVGNMITSGADVSAGSYEEKDSEGKLMPKEHSGECFVYNNFEGMKEFLSREVMDIYVWTKIYRKQLLDLHAIRFEAGRNDEDFLFNHQVFLHAEKTVFIDRPLYTYYVREASESRVFYRKAWRKYLHNTLYRTYRIETLTAQFYPELLALAKRQTIRYNVMMLGRSLSAGYDNSEPYFSYIMRYQRRNRKQVIAQRRYWGMSLPGVLAMTILPSRLYFALKRVKV